LHELLVHYSCSDRFWRNSGIQPPDYVNAPPEIEAAEKKRQRAIEERERQLEQERQERQDMIEREAFAAKLRADRQRAEMQAANERLEFEEAQAAATLRQLRAAGELSYRDIERRNELEQRSFMARTEQEIAARNRLGAASNYWNNMENMTLAQRGQQTYENRRRMVDMDERQARIEATAWGSGHGRMPGMGSGGRMLGDGGYGGRRRIAQRGHVSDDSVDTDSEADSDR